MNRSASCGGDAPSGEDARSAAPRRGARQPRPSIVSPARASFTVRPAAVVLGGEMGGEPVAGELGDRSRGCRAPRTGGWRRARRRGGSRTAVAPGLAVELEHDLVSPPTMSSVGARDRSRGAAGEVGAPTTRDDGGDVGARARPRPRGRRRHPCWHRSSRWAARPASGWARSHGSRRRAGGRAARCRRRCARSSSSSGVSRSKSSVPRPASLRTEAT